MAQGFTLFSDPDVTTFRKVKVASGTAIFRGTVMDRVRGSATVDAQPSTASSTTSSIYGVTTQTISSTDTSVLIALITPRQLWMADCGATGGGTALAAQNGQRMIFGTQTITVGTTAAPAGDLTITTTSGVVTLATGTSFTTATTVNNTGSDVTGTTGVFEQTAIAPLVSTARVVGRLLYEHAA